MPRHSFIQMTKLPDVRGRVDYISNPKRQEHLYATYSTINPEFWKYLSEQAQYDFRKSNQKNGKCIEARELVIALPEKLQTVDPELVLKLFTETFRTKYDVQCTAALHHNKAKTNYHIHLIFADRMPLEETEIKYAPRNMFYDENGRHVRTKKEIMDENKQIRPGCRIIPKGSIYEIRFFSERKDLFKEKSFLQEVKIMYTDLINQCLRDEKDKLQIFDKSGPYLPTKKVGKNNPKANEIQSDNELRKEWNRTVDQVLIAGGSQEDVIDFKKEYVTDKVAESIRINGCQPGIFALVLRQAISVLKTFLRFLMFRSEKEEKRAAEKAAPVKETVKHYENAEEPVVTFDPAELQRAKAEYMHLETLHKDLDAINRRIYAIDRSINKLNKQLKMLEITIVDKALHVFERKELRKKISAEEDKLKRAKSQMELFPAQHGFDSVRDIEQSFRAAKKEYEVQIGRQEEYNRSVTEAKTKRREMKAINANNNQERKTVEMSPAAKSESRVKSEKQMDRTDSSVPVRREESLSDENRAAGHYGKPVYRRQSILKNLAEKQEQVDRNKQINRNQTRSTNRRKGGPEL